MSHAQRVLITNFVLDQGSGTEMYVFDLVLHLLRIGRLPVVYSPRLGALAQRMQQKGIPVVDCINKIGEAPDVIHGNHTLETIAAAVRFPQVPVVFVCHDCSSWYDKAPVLPNVRRYVGVDQACLDRMVLQDGIPSQIAAVIPNGVNLERFPRRQALPPVPRSLVCFGNEFREPEIEIVRNAVPGLHVESIGLGSHRHIEEPGPWLQQFDIVLARGRSAREALATGAATIVADKQGLGGMVTSKNYQHFQRNNFGRRLLQSQLTVESVRTAVNQYDAADASQVAMEHCNSFGLEVTVAELLRIYDDLAGEGISVDAASTSIMHQQMAFWIEWATRRANGACPVADTIPPGMPVSNLRSENSVPAAKANATSAVPLMEKSPKKPTVVRIRRELNRFLQKMRSRILRATSN